jgi:hypothetical protein
MKDPLKQNQILKNSEKHKERAKAQDRALRDNLRRRKQAKPQGKEDR